jgi:sulfite exporter TauE/SafE
LAWLRLRSRSSALLEHFAVQMAGWGGVELAFVALSWRALAPRDLADATRLDRLLWLNAGLDVGYVLVGVSLAITGWKLGRRLGLVGAGIGVVVQGAALLLLDLLLASQISR